MPRRLSIEHRGEVPASPESTYAVMADATRRPEWLVELRTVDAPPGLLTAGDVFTGRSHAFAHEVTGMSHVLEATGSAILRERVVVGIGIRTTWRLEGRPDGTTGVTAHLDVEAPGGALALPERLVLRWWLGRMQKRSLRALAGLEELSGSAAPSRRRRWRWSSRPPG